MINKEQVAHDLTMVYLNNRYGVNIEGYFSILDGDGHGNVSTEKLPAVSEIKYRKVGTGEKNFLGLEKKTKIEDGLMIDDIIDDLINEYHQVYNRILERLSIWFFILHNNSNGVNKNYIVRTIKSKQKG